MVISRLHRAAKDAAPAHESFSGFYRKAEDTVLFLWRTSLKTEEKETVVTTFALWCLVGAGTDDCDVYMPG